jgi:DNA segregation ATPase FtsK/SpoIIIE, S-DNA-T family
MVGIRSGIAQAAAAHRRAAAIATAAESVLRGYVPPARTATQLRAQQDLARRLTTAAEQLAPGWLGAALDAPASGLAQPAPGAATRPTFVRVGAARPLPGAEFPALVPLGHVAFDADAAEDPRVAGVLQAMLLRLVATAPTGTRSVRMVDPAGLVAPLFTALAGAGIMAPPVSDLARFQALLTDLAQHPGDRTALVVIAGWPRGAGAPEINRLAAVAAAGGGTHLLVAGWPPPEATPGRPLPGATQVTLRDPSALVGHPPGGSFATGVPPGVPPTPGLNAEVLLDPAPPAELVRQVCDRLAARVTTRSRPARGGSRPHHASQARDAGLSVVVGRAGRADGAPVTLRLGGSTWHWLVGGRPGSGKSTMLHHLVYGLALRYGPDQLAVHLFDPTGDGFLATLAAAVPHTRAAAVGSVNRVRASLQEVAAQAARRHRPTRLLCVLDGLDDVRDDQTYAQLCSLAADGPHRNLHLLLAGTGAPPAQLASHCRVRIALPGGQVLDPANHSASELITGTAVVNTASGLGGPPGVTRAHEQMVNFPDPYADPEAMAGLRRQLTGGWR